MKVTFKRSEVKKKKQMKCNNNKIKSYFSIYLKNRIFSISYRKSKIFIITTTERDIRWLKTFFCYNDDVIKTSITIYQLSANAFKVTLISFKHELMDQLLIKSLN